MPQRWSCRCGARMCGGLVAQHLLHRTCVVSLSHALRLELMHATPMMIMTVQLEVLDHFVELFERNITVDSEATGVSTRLHKLEQDVFSSLVYSSIML
jgi:hypothetical protein